MKNSTGKIRKILILGIGNILMGDEGVGVHVVNTLEKAALPADVECLDGGVGSFLLLEQMQSAERVILIDATVDGRPTGNIRRLEPKFSADYPRTLTAHDIGLKDLIDAFHLMGKTPKVVLFAISIPPLQDMHMDLSPELIDTVPRVAQMVMEEVARSRPATAYA